jgi:hypothetical protein
MVAPVQKTNGEKVQAVLVRTKQLEKNKQPWLAHLQLLGEYIHTRKQSFTSDQQKGDFLNRELFDSGAPKANKTMASTLVGMLWPPSAKKFRLRPPRGIGDKTDEKEYYEFITNLSRQTLDHERAGLRGSYDEYMLDQGAFGTSGIEVIEADDTEDIDVLYKAWGIQEMKIAEGKNGRIDTIYLELKFPIHRVVAEYGLSAVSEKTRNLYKTSPDDEIKLLIAIEPRKIRDYSGKGPLDRPFQAIHVEMDQKVLLREKGYDELPIKVGRFTKLINEEYGRSPGMDALPSILETNAIWESVTIAIEKNLDPPLGVLDDGRLGNAEIDTSAGAINVFNIAGKAGENPVFPLYTVGEVRQTTNLLESLEKDISDHFFLDRLLDFNNETTMTLGEVQVRNKMRHQTLGSVFSRQIQEVFSPVIERTVNILFKKGRLGVVEGSVEHTMAVLEGRDIAVIPASVVALIKAGKDFYEIEYFTPAMQIMSAEENEGLFRAWQFAQALSQTNPNATIVLDEDYSVRRFTENSGAPSEAIRSKQKVAEILAEMDKQRQEQMQLEQAKQAAEAARNAGQSGLFPVPTKQAESQKPILV